MRRKTSSNLARGGVYGRRKARGSSRSKKKGDSTAGIGDAFKDRKRPGMRDRAGNGTRVEDYRSPYYKSFGVGSRTSGSNKKNLGH